jgi:hypothetical protein
VNHGDVHAHMADYLEAGLGLTQRALFDAHLDGCDACTQELDELQRTISLVRELPEEDPPPFLVEKIMARIRDGEGRTTVADHIRSWLGALASPRVALPASALAVGLAMASGNLDPSSFDPSRVLPGTFGTSLTDQRSAQATRSPGRGSAPDLRIARSERLGVATRVGGGGRVSPVVADVLAKNRLRAERRFQPLSISSSSPPPAVARAPRIRIPVRGEASGLKGLVARRSQGRSIRMQVADRSAGGGLAPAGVLAEAQSAFNPRPAPADEQRHAREERKRIELGRRLNSLVRRPAAFSADFAILSIAEQEIWVGALAEHAREVERGPEVLGALRMTADLRSLQLATAFAVELRRVDAKHRAKIAALSITERD